jgi:PAS domain S-box-containing protein
MTMLLKDVIEADAGVSPGAEAGVAWLVEPEAGRLLWASPAAARLWGLEDNGDAAGRTLPQAGRALERLRQLAATPAAPARLERLLLPFTGRMEPVTALCQPLPLREGGVAALVIAAQFRPLGRPVPPPPMAALPLPPILVAAADELPPAPLAEAAPPALAAADTAVPAVAEVAAPTPEAAEPEPEPELAEAPAAPAPEPAAAPFLPLWLMRASHARRPLRFVWQSDREGRFVHVSRELAEAVGPASGNLVGRRFDEIAAAHGISGGDDIGAHLAEGRTWSGATTLWPVQGTRWSVPVQWAGVPVLDRARQFEGFRGYGIVRLESATEQPPEPESADSTEPPPEARALETQAPETQAPEAITAVVEDTLQPAQQPSDDPTLVVADEPEAEAATAAEAAVESPAVVTAETPAVAPEAPPAADMPPLLHEETSAEAAAPPVEDAAPAPAAEPAPEAMDELRAVLAEAAVPEAEVADAALTDTGDSPQDAEPELPFVAEQPSPTAPAVAALSLLPPSQPTAEGAALSHHERNAFREIAKALGARLEGDEPPLAAVPTPAPLVPAPPVPAPPHMPPPANDSQAPAALPEAGAVAGYSPGEPSLRLGHAGAAGNLDEAAPRLLDRLPMGIMVTQHGEAQFLNRTLLDLLGFEDLADVMRHGGAARLLRGRTPERLEGTGQVVSLTSREGELVHAEAIGQPVEWNRGAATLLSFRKALDGSETPKAKALELDLLSARAQLREARFVLDTATDGIISLDEKGRILSLNRSAEALFGYDQNEVAGERFTLLLSPESHAAAFDYLEGLRVNGVAAVLNDGREVMGRERKGGRIPLFMTLGRVGEGDSGKFCAVLRDITQWKRAEAELIDAKRAAERASAQKSDVLAKISHEIRTPLNAIIGFAEVMMEERFGPVGTPRYKDYLKDIHTSGGHVISLVNDLLDLSKIEAGRMELTFTGIDLNEIVASSVAIMQPQANSARVLVRTQLAPKLPPVVADARSVRQIVLNLLSNAAKFTEAGGQVIVTTALSEAGEAVVRVRDTGIGMTPDEVEAAMLPFRQVSGPRAKGGTGLGLPLTKALVEANRAAFHIRSTPREGTLVEVVFPATRVLAE